MKPLGQLTVICGSMFAGKSEELIRLVRRAMYARKKPTPLSPLSRGERVLIRVHRLSSLCAGRARFFALTPSPSPTLWERGAARGHVWSAEALASAWAEASLPHSIIPLSRLAGEGAEVCHFEQA